MWTLQLVGLLALLAGAVAAKPIHIPVLHFNDVHNRVEPADSFNSACTPETDAKGACFGGWARMVTLVKQQRALYPNLVLLDAGDNFQGTIYDTVYKGSLNPILLNELHVDATSLGNHEFDYNTTQLALVLRNYTMPILGACNTNTNGTPLAGLIKKWTILQRGSIKIGVIGVVTTTTKAGDERPGDNVTFTEEISSLKACVKQFRLQHKDMNAVIALTHVGYDIDQKIAAQVPGLDVIIGGHSHTFLWGNATGVKGPLLNVAKNTYEYSQGPYPTYVQSPTAGKKVPVVTAKTASRYMGFFLMRFDSNGKYIGLGTNKVILLGGNASYHNVEQDAAMNQLILGPGGLQTPVQALSTDVIGTTTADLTRQGQYEYACSSGSFVTDAMLFYIKNATTFESTYGKVSLAITNAGSIRSDLPEGNQTAASVITVFPFDDLITVVNITGADFIRALENSLKTTSEGETAAVVSGTQLVWNLNLPNGSRITSLKIDDGTGTYFPVDPCKAYLLAASDYLISGQGAEFETAFDNAVTVLPNGPSISYLLAPYLQAHSPYTPVTSQPPRISACVLASGPGNDPSNPACSSPVITEVCPSRRR